MFFAIIALILIIISILFTIFFDKRSKCFLLLSFILILRMARIIIHRFFIQQLYDIDGFHSLTIITDVITITIYSLIVGFSILLLLKEKKET